MFLSLELRFYDPELDLELLELVFLKVRKIVVCHASVLSIGFELVQEPQLLLLLVKPPPKLVSLLGDLRKLHLPILALVIISENCRGFSAPARPGSSACGIIRILGLELESPQLVHQILVLLPKVFLGLPQQQNFLHNLAMLFPLLRCLNHFVASLIERGGPILELLRGPLQILVLGDDVAQFRV